jgi:hypothetical protein
MQFSRSLFALVLGSLIAQSSFANFGANADTLKRLAVGGGLFYAVKTLNDRKVENTANKALHTQSIDLAAKTVQWVNHNKLALLAGAIGATLVAELIKLPAPKTA